MLKSFGAVSHFRKTNKIISIYLKSNIMINMTPSSKTHTHTRKKKGNIMGKINKYFSFKSNWNIFWSILPFILTISKIGHGCVPYHFAWNRKTARKKKNENHLTVVIASGVWAKNTKTTEQKKKKNIIKVKPSQHQLLPREQKNNNKSERLYLLFKQL